MRITQATNITGRDFSVIAVLMLATVVLMTVALVMAGCGGASGGGGAKESASDWGDGTGGGQAQSADASAPNAEWQGETGDTGGDDGGWGDTTDSGGPTGSQSGTGTGNTGPNGTGTSGNTGPNGECIANCNGKQCGPDGCGGSCGWCGGGDSCQQGACVDPGECTPECAGQMVGAEDGCGGVCSGSGFGIGLVPGGAQDAAYFKSQVMAGNVPQADHLPVEGFLTEHGTALPPPEYDRLVTLHGFVGLFYDPSVGEPTVALQLGMNSGLGPEAIEEGKFNLSVVVDRSGSMDADGKMEFVKDGLIKMLDALDADDTLSIVTYSTTAKVALEPTLVTDEAKPQIQALIENLSTGGKTNLYGGLKLGYEQVMKNAAKKELTPRVILLSDGVVNEGITDHDAILGGSKSYNDAGIGVTTIGVGNDFNFDLMHLLAAQGSGNFYFLDTAEKLAEVFQEEIKYLLTPVADNLQVWFTLPDGFGVEDIYGFDYKQTNGEFHLLGPSAQYTVSGDEVVENPEPSDEEPNVAVSTLFASKKNGLLMVKLNSPTANKLKDYENMNLATVYYSYDLVDTGETEAWDVDINIGSLEYDDSSDSDGGYHYFSGAIMQKNFCVLRAALAMKGAVAAFHEQGEDGIQTAITLLNQAGTFCKGINTILNDTQIVEDVTLMSTLMDNICGDVCLDPAGQ